MSKKTKAKLPTVTVNGFKLTIDGRGNVNGVTDDDSRLQYATASEIAAIAKHATAVRDAGQIEDMTATGYEVSFMDDNSGDVSFGCQQISYADVQRIAKLSAAARSRKRTARRRAAAPAA